MCKLALHAMENRKQNTAERLIYQLGTDVEVMTWLKIKRHAQFLIIMCTPNLTWLVQHNHLYNQGARKSSS